MSIYSHNMKHLDYKSIKEINESISINSQFIEKNDSFYNIEKWPNKNNVLYVTGLSGSGKSTLTNDLKEKYKANIVSLDHICAYYRLKCKEQNKYDFMYNKVLSGYPKAVKFFEIKKPGISYKYTESFQDPENIKIVRDFINFIETKCKNDKIIIEGAHLFIALEYSFFIDKSLIIKNIDYNKSMKRRIGREESNEDKAKIKKYNKEYADELKEDYNKITSLKKFIDSEVENIIAESVSNIKNIVFDFGEVLILSDKTFAYNFYNSTLKPLGFTEDEFEDFIKGFFKFAHDHENESNVDKKYKDTVDRKWYPFYDKLIDYCLHVGYVAEYAKDLLSSLADKGYKLYYLSNQSKWNWEAVVRERVQILMPYFEGGIISCDVGLRKPDKLIYKALLSEYNLNPEECLFIDDKKKNIDAAKACKMKAKIFDKKCLKYLQSMKAIKSINESKDISTLEDGFKKKSGKSFKLIDLNTQPALKYVSDKWRNEKYASIAICKEDDKLAGFVYVGKSGNIGPLEVYKNYRGYGLSEILMKESINKYNGYQLGVYSDNEVAIKLYKKLGFVKIDQYKEDNDTIYLMKLKSKLSKDDVIQESTDASTLDSDFKKKDKIKLSDLRMESRQRNDEGKSLVLSWYDDKGFVATVLVDTIPASDGYKWFGSFRVSKKYRGSGLGDQIMKLITSSRYKAGALSVYKDNEVAINLYKKHGFKISKERTSKDYYFMYLEKNRYKSAITESTNIDDKFKTPKELSDWMKKNIKYKEFTKLMSAEEVYAAEGGSCHDQAEFENYMFNRMHIKHGRIFFIEYNKDSNQGGITHTFLWYKEKDKFYWFENAWGGQEGIHGPYNSISEMKKEVKELHMKNSKFDDIEFATVKNVKPGMNLQEYVDVCLG